MGVGVLAWVGARALDYRVAPEPNPIGTAMLIGALLAFIAAKIFRVK